ncbi:MAG: signal peptidase I [Acidobacteriia bacterium]|nr:signal peptidase I [Terriglobia bacterium]
MKEKKTGTAKEIEEKKPATWLESLWENIKSLAMVLIAVLLIRAVVVEATVVPTGSMQNTILIGDHLFLDKILYGPQIPFTDYHFPAIKKYQRGDVVAFRYPVDPSVVFVKRLIGMPGDTIQVKQKDLYINGKKLNEPCVIHRDPQTYPDAEWIPREARIRDNFGPVTVPPDHYFAMGDNRDESLDSRYWGFVPAENMVGEPMFVYWSYDAPTDVWTASDISKRIRDDLDIITHFASRTRWARMGKVVRSDCGEPR